jgi:hypothetical protein
LEGCGETAVVFGETRVCACTGAPAEGGCSTCARGFPGIWDGAMAGSVGPWACQQQLKGASGVCTHIDVDRITRGA